PPDLPNTRDMLMRACDVRLPARLKRDELDFIANALLRAVQDVMGPELEYGT
ncbi:MAG: aminotransferase, partial [Pseudomonadota bacterium]